MTNVQFVYLSSLAFSVFPIGTSIIKPARNLPEEVVESRINNRSPAASRVCCVTGLVCRDVSSVVGVLQMSSVEAPFLIVYGKGFTNIYVFIIIYKMVCTK